MQIVFLNERRPDLTPLSLQLSTSISKTIEDFLFVNQLLTKQDKAAAVNGA